MTTNRGIEARPRSARRCFLFRRFARNSDGATAVEFALLAIPFLLVVFAILEAGVSIAVQQLLVNATDDVARQIRTGQVTTVSQSSLKDMICERIQSLVTSGCPGLKVDLRTYTSYQQAASQVVYVLPDNVALEMDGNSGKALKAEIGGSSAKQTLRTFYFWPLMTNLMESSMSSANNSGKILLSASQTWQNEAY